MRLDLNPRSRPSWHGIVTGLFLGALVVLGGCSSGDDADASMEEAVDGSAMGALGAPVEGFDAAGNPKSCPPMPATTVCSTQITDGERFAEQCRSAGHTVTQCACHDYICSANLIAAIPEPEPEPEVELPPERPRPEVPPGTKFRGYDANGYFASCTAISADRQCERQATAADEYAERCEAAGHQALQCDCEFFLCSEKL